MIRRYSELIRIPTFEERFEYLRVGGAVGQATFDAYRYLNQAFYTSKEWRRFRKEIIVRDEGCDMAMDGYSIVRGIVIHHIMPLDIDDLENMTDAVFDPENVVCVSANTHRAIHYGNKDLLPKLPIERKPNDTCPWK